MRTIFAIGGELMVVTIAVMIASFGQYSFGPNATLADKVFGYGPFGMAIALFLLGTGAVIMMLKS